MRGKRLAMIVKHYPYEGGEPFVHRELETLSTVFGEIVLISRKPVAEGEKPVFVLPSNVRHFNIPVSASRKGKIRALISGLMDNGLSRVLTDLRAQHVPLRSLTLKTALGYDEQRLFLGRRIFNLFRGHGLRYADFVWYSYWNDEAAYLLADWRRSGIIGNAFSRTHGFDIYAERHPFNYLPYRGFMAEHLTGVHCISDHGRNYLMSKNEGFQGKFITARLGVTDRDIVSPSPRQPLRVLSLSGIDRVKNLESLIAGLSLIEDITVEWHHVGSGNNAPHIRLIRSLAADKLGGLSNVIFTFHGFVQPKELFGKLGEIVPHVLLNTSTFEGIPVSMMEAASIGLPIIGPNVCGVPEIVLHGENGFLIDPQSPDDIRDRLHEMATMGDEKYEAMCRRSQEIQRERFNAERNYREFAEFLANAR